MKRSGKDVVLRSGNLDRLAILGHFGNDQNGSLELISMHQTIKGDPNDGLYELKPTQSFLNHIPT